MSEQFDRFITLLKGIFELDKSDLDFGIYRIMNIRRREVEKFLKEGLPKKVEETLAPFASSDSDEARKRIKEIENSLGGPDAISKLSATIPLVSEYNKLKDSLAKGVDLAALETDVYSHLYSFFNRYYEDGDFISKRRYKDGVYAIPYEGEEVKLYWANQDQYYIKTSENFQDYVFTSKGISCHFELVNATTEQNNTKETDDEKREFMLYVASEPVDNATEDLQASDGDELEKSDAEPRETFEYHEDKKKLIIRFIHDIPKDQKVNYPQDNLDRIKKWLTTCDAHEKLSSAFLYNVSKDPKKTKTLLEKHLKAYVAKNTFDYFIHKDLKKFLVRELDFYIKNEIMHLDDLDTENEKRIESYIGIIRAIKRVGTVLIDFLAQIENFQKKLWLKKKFVVQCDYCITLDRIPKEFYGEIFSNEKQLEEWRSLGIPEDLLTMPVGEKIGDLQLEVSDSHLPQYSLMVDTKFFSQLFKEKLLVEISSIDGYCNGLLIKSENFQALDLLSRKYQERIKCIYIDPPYNTGKDGFLYKDRLRDSSWLAMMNDRLIKLRDFLSNDGLLLSSISENEVTNLHVLFENIFYKNNYLATFVWNNEGNIDNQSKVKYNHEYILAACKNENDYPHAKVIAPDIEKDSKLYNDTIENSITKNGPANPQSEVVLPVGFPTTIKSGKISARSDEWPILKDDAIFDEYKLLSPVRALSGWSARKLLDEFITNECKSIVDSKGLVTWFKLTHTGAIYCYKERKDPSHVLSIIKNVGTVKKTSSMLNEMGLKFTYPKPVNLISYLFQLVNDNDAIVLDCFSGSGTSAHSIISLNQSTHGDRKYILVEMSPSCFNMEKLRIEKLIYSPDWKNCSPVTFDKGLSHCFKYMTLESYEDALSNIELPTEDTTQQYLKLGDQYLINYMLDLDTTGNMLNRSKFSDPFNYKLKITERNETKDTVIDLVETFNYLIGLTVDKMYCRRTFAAIPDTAGDYEGAVKLRSDTDGPFTFRQIEGTLQDGKRALIIWRTITENLIECNAALDAFFERYRLNPKERDFDIIYVNGDNNLENLKLEEESWKVRMIEPVFSKLMFEEE